jgi:hypothetical protein
LRAWGLLEQFMTTNLSRAALLAALLMSGVSALAVAQPAYAQDQYGDASFDSFHDELSNYGDWIYSDRWGEVWIPATDDNFSPYNTNGYWAYTNDYGWTWVSGYEWGDIPFHYGRWVNDPDDGWLWIPGYVWSPAWVAWRSNGSYIGWMPLPPDDAFLGGGEQYADNTIHIGIDFNDDQGLYGYRRWYSDYDDRRFAANWVFVNPGHVGDREFHRFAAPAGSNALIIRNTRNITNYSVVNNHVVNRSVNIAVVNGAGGHVRPVDARSVVRNQAMITSFTAGRAAQVRVRAVNPHGTGTPFSAPKPSDNVVKTLSTRVPPKLSGRGNAHLFTRDTITAAPLPPRRGGIVDRNQPLPPAPGAKPADRNIGVGDGAAPQSPDAHKPSGAMPPSTDVTPNGQGLHDRDHRGHRGEPAVVAPSGQAPSPDVTPNDRVTHIGAPAVVAPNGQPPSPDTATPRGLPPATDRMRDRGQPAPGTIPPGDNLAPRGRDHVAPPSVVQPDAQPSERRTRHHETGTVPGSAPTEQPLTHPLQAPADSLPRQLHNGAPAIPHDQTLPPERHHDEAPPPTPSPNNSDAHDQKGEHDDKDHRKPKDGDQSQ